MILRAVRNQFATALLDLLFPPHCLACEQSTDSADSFHYICRRCRQELRPVSAEFAQINILDRLDPCYLDEARIAFRFNEVLRSMIHPLKYRKMPQVGRQLGHLSPIKTDDVDWLVPVPLYRTRRIERGYNQSEFIARGILENSERDILRPELLSRQRATGTQTHLNRREREENLSGAFVVDRQTTLSGKCIAVVDDVITTGTTLNECARLLKAAGAERVVAMALAAPVRAVENLSLDAAKNDENDWLW